MKCASFFSFDCSTPDRSPTSPSAMASSSLLPAPAPSPVLQPFLHRRPSAIAALLRSLESLPLGRIAHHCALLHPHLHSDPFLSNLLLHMYARCGALHDSIALFSSRPSCPRDALSWNLVVAACSRHGGDDGSLALSFFRRMMIEGVAPDMVTFAAVFSSLHPRSSSSSPPRLREGKFLHACILQDLNLSVSTALMHMYGKCGLLSEAWLAFHAMDVKDVVAWNCILSLCQDSLMEGEIMSLYERMELDDALPDKVTFVALLSACACSSDVISGQRFHHEILSKGFEIDLKVGNALVNMYAKCGELGAARFLFDRLMGRNLISWNVMLGAYAQRPDGHGVVVLSLIDQMRKEGFQLNDVTFLSIASRCPLIYLLKVFETIDKINVAVWNAMISSCICHRENEKGCQIFQQMQEEGIIPNEITVISVLSLYSCEETLLKAGIRRHALLVGSGLDGATCVANALMTMYLKCRRFEDAEMTFKNLLEPNLVSFTLMMQVFVQTGRCSQVLELFRRMQWKGFSPDGFTYASALDACASLFAFSEVSAAASATPKMPLAGNPISETISHSMR